MSKVNEEAKKAAFNRGLCSPHGKDNPETYAFVKGAEWCAKEFGSKIKEDITFLRDKAGNDGENVIAVISYNMAMSIIDLHLFPEK